MNSDNKSFKQAAALISLLLIGGLLVYTLSGFLTAFLSAIILYVLFKPVMKFLCEKWRWNKNIAVLAIIIISFVTILLPFSGITLMLSTKVNYVLNHSEDIITGLKRVDAFLNEKIGVAILSDESLTKIREAAASIIPQALGKTMEALTTMGILYFILFFLLKQYGIVEEKMEEYLPFSRENAHKFISELKSMVFSSVLGAPLLAIIQGLFAWFGFWMFGLPEPLFWGTVCGFFSLIPMVGTALVWIPAGLFQLTAGLQWQGIAILLYGGLIITNIDNVFRFVLQKKIADVHPVITLLGVIMGINLLGIPGIVFGPLFLSWFLLLVKIYKSEFGDAPKIILSDSPGFDEIKSEAQKKPVNENE